MTMREKAIKKVEKKLKFSPYFWYRKEDYSRFVKAYLVGCIVYVEIFDRVVSENPTSSVWDFKRLNYD